ncbi:Hypothetical predicted protein, partial [Paramuricea clavata]
MPVIKEALKINSNGLEITYFKTLSISIGILEGPAALPVFKDDIISSISSLVVGKTAKLLLSGVELIKEILTERPFDNPKGSRRIGLVWERIVDNLNSRADVVFNLKDIRAVRDRYNLLAKKIQKGEEINASGIGTDEPSELEDAIEEAVALFESQEEEREKEKTAKDEDRSQAE